MEQILDEVYCKFITLRNTPTTRKKLASKLKSNRLSYQRTKKRKGKISEIGNDQTEEPVVEEGDTQQ